MNRLDHLLDIDAVRLIGRTAADLIGDIHDVGMLDDLRADLDVLRAGLMVRSLRLAPTRTRYQAVDLATMATCLCGDEDEIDRLLAFVRDWLDAQGDLGTMARHHVAVHAQAAMLRVEHDLTGFRHVRLGEDKERMLQERFDALHAEDREAIDASDRLDADMNGCFMATGGPINVHFHDARTICISITEVAWESAIVGMLDIHDDDGGRAAVPVPEMAA